MRLKLSELHEPLRRRIQAQIAAEDANRDLRSLEAGQPEPTQKALDCIPSQHSGRTRGVGACIVSLLVQTRRLMDRDNLVASIKPLQDAIARSLGIDDGSERVIWQYSQAETKGQQGVIVSVEMI